MVCDRCIWSVNYTLASMGITPHEVKLGEVRISRQLTEGELSELSEKLNAFGFEILCDKKHQLIESVKNLVIKIVHYHEEFVSVNYSNYIEENLNKDYKYLSTLFSEVEGTTIEKYIINQKIERAKELLVYNELTLSEIAYKLGYSSVAYLSTQFKNITGYTPSHFKGIKEIKRKSLDKV